MLSCEYCMMSNTDLFAKKWAVLILIYDTYEQWFYFMSLYFRLKKIYYVITIIFQSYVKVFEYDLKQKELLATASFLKDLLIIISSSADILIRISENALIKEM